MDVEADDLFAGKLAPTRIDGVHMIFGTEQYLWETDTLARLQKHVEIDLKYINNWSLWLDLMILVKTPFTLLSKDIY